MFQSPSIDRVVRDRLFCVLLKSKLRVIFVVYKRNERKSYIYVFNRLWKNLILYSGSLVCVICGSCELQLTSVNAGVGIIRICGKWYKYA